MKKFYSLLTLLVVLCSTPTFSQLVAGDIAFIGMNEDLGASQNDDFSWIALKDIPAGTQIYFTEQGVNTTDWFANTEGHIRWTAPVGGTPCGTVVNIFESTITPDNMNASSGTVTGPVSLDPLTTWNLSGGDQVLAYVVSSGGHRQANFANTTFIAGIHLNDDQVAGETSGWTATTYVGTGTAECMLPPGLTNGTNCISLFSGAGNPEFDNVKFTGSLIGTAAAVRAAINTTFIPPSPGAGGWQVDDLTPFNITPAGYAPNVTCAPPCADGDGDTYTDIGCGGTDCNDANAAINPGATEICDGVDNDCDLAIDEGQANFDGDGFCDLIDPDDDNDGSLDGPDCNDFNASILPGAPEITCNGIDENCNGNVDDAPNIDGDGFTTCAGDCNDNNPLIFPGAVEILCDGIDQNCNGPVDDGTPVTYYRDADGDTYGTAGTTTISCTGPPPGFVANNTDCDDSNSARNPGATEICDGIDNDCDAVTDEGQTNTDGLDQCNLIDPDDDNDGVADGADNTPLNPDFCRDLDLDGCDDCSVGTDNFGALADFNTANDGIDTDNDGLCNSGDPDDDNDGVADGSDNTPLNPDLCRDLDLDGCDDCAVGTDNLGPLADFSISNDGTDVDGDGYCTATDCDDNNAAINPGATEICDGIDNNCTMGIDEGQINTDGDAQCDAIDSDDDNDGVADVSDINSLDPDVCQDSDGDGCDDCAVGTDDFGPMADNMISNDGTDVDGDGYCTATDCNDGDPAVNPGAMEICNNGIDDDCNPATIDLFDADIDGFDCSVDCDDADPAVNPGAMEICNNGIDDDCNPATLDIFDADIDGFDCSIDCDDADPAVNPGAMEICNNGIDDDCNPATIDLFDADIDGFDCSVDCDDADPAVNPGAMEICNNGIDDDCNPATLDIFDADIDGFDCSVDCDDADPAVNPGAMEICNNGIDDDCNPATLDIFDADIDGFDCSVDCDDADPAVNPGAMEICNNGIDDDCNPATIDLFDADIDGFDCSVDCDDADPAVNPGAMEICNNGIDDDCNPATLDIFDADIDGFDCSVDCDDADPAVNPGATEICNNGIDDDCNPATLDIFDADIDGFDCSVDCDDADPAVNPGAMEICNNGIDDDCNPATIDLFDADIDGFDCSVDCDDADPAVNPGAMEICNNGIDDDCNPATLDIFDADIDGFDCSVDCDDADPAVNPGAMEICNNGIDDDCNPATIDLFDADIDGFDCSVDCDDADPAVNPGAMEICNNGIDDDCNPATLDIFDADIDGFDCSIDCDDADPAVNPGAMEICNNGIDDDCNPATIDLFDADIDGFDCSVDCDDADPAVNPGAMEICNNGIDDDCNPATIDLFDADIDGFDCSVDCDDADPAVNPGAMEICDGLDNDCDLTIDEGLGIDFDGDGHGDPASCATDATLVIAYDDCNDANLAMFPGNPEVCDGLDNNCDGFIDEGLLNTDGDSQCDLIDTDDDNDGVLDGPDTANLDPDVCQDLDMDGCDDCSVGTDNFGPLADFSASNDGLDTDADGLCNFGDSDDDNDGVADGSDTNPLNPDVCQDLDMDGCDDCSVGTDNFGPLPDFSASNDGLDTDADGSCNFGDSDDDNDGVLDGPDTSDLNPDICQDLDGDGCDDCSVGTDNFGPLPDFSASNDGLDTDADGLCNFGDSDDDNDGVADGPDTSDLNPDICQDLDGDGCDDCSVGTDNLGPLPDFSASNDGLDTDADGLCNFGDSDDDNDGVADGSDTNPLNPDVCQDLDLDGCDDCSVGTDNLGPLPDFSASNDGLDTDADGLCNFGDSDDDNDGVADGSDPSTLNPDICGNADGDGCDDCSVGTDNFGPLPDNTPMNDGLDTDADGLCNFGDSDDDNDGVADGSDPSPLNPDICGNADGDGCDDCSLGTDNFGPLPDNTPMNDGLDTDGDGLCNFGDSDDDNDGVLDGSDPSSTNPDICGNVDGDGCDDCSVGTDNFGPLPDNTPFNDGLDTDSDGSCNFGDSDDDNDGVLDGPDTSDLNPDICQDLDGDGCDDCSVGTDNFGPLADNTPLNDGTDADGDGYCTATDCNDGNAGINPGAVDIPCDGIDQNCSGGDVLVDADSDGFNCAVDCNDGNPAVNPGATEICNNGIDDDCNIATLDLFDADSDGETCDTDCDDSNPNNFNGNIEVCDAADNDCDGFVDNGLGIDFDGDGHGNPGSCTSDATLLIPYDDCDDLDANNFPGNPELCDGQDNNCNFLADAVGGEVDIDNDGVLSCDDCADFDPNNFPGNTEVCDGTDNDCDGIAENGLLFINYYIDFDGDGFGDATSAPVATCDGPPLGFVTDNTDCVDSDPLIFPGAPELCDGLDNDCDGIVPVNELDVDADGFSPCEGDCNDTDPAINPTAVEIPCNGIDDDCNPATADDGIAPTAVCTNITVFLGANGTVSITAADIDGGSFDNCGSVSISASQTNFSCGDVGPNTVTLTVSDGDGMTATCNAIVTVLDNIAPFPAVATQPNIVAGCIVNVLTPPLAIDNCPGVITATHNATLPITTQGTTVITWTYTDQYGNASTQTQNVIIDDVTVPVPQVASLPPLNGQCSVFPASPIAYDVCQGLIVGTTTTPLPITTQGTVTVTWSYDDGNGNVITQNQVITVLDNTDPVPSVPTLSNIVTVCSANPTPPTANDNCSGSITGTTTTPLPITTIGTTVVTWTYMDVNGNSTTQNQSVTVSNLNATTTTSADGITITANNTNASAYQWINCGTNLPITGETGISFTATVNGDYAVQVTEDGCTVTSPCVTVASVGVVTITSPEMVLYPNPTTTGHFTVQYDGVIESIDVFDMLGRLIMLPADLSTGEVDGSSLAYGKYMVRVSTDKGIITKQVIIAK